jgi:hypothetical protein
MATTRFQPVPGEDKSLKLSVLEFGSQIAQKFDPIKKINLHLCGYAFYQEDPSRQVLSTRYYNITKIL